VKALELSALYQDLSKGTRGSWRIKMDVAIDLFTSMPEIEDDFGPFAAPTPVNISLFSIFSSFSQIHIYIYTYFLNK